MFARFIGWLRGLFRRPVPEAYPRVLVVCTGNTCRSAMAEGLIRAKFKVAHVASAGTSAVYGAAAAAHAITVCREHGSDISNHTARPLRDVPLAAFDLVVAMTPTHADTVKLAADRQGASPAIVTLGVPDPFGGSLDTYRRCAEAIIVKLNTEANLTLR